MAGKLEENISNQTSNICVALYGYLNYILIGIMFISVSFNTKYTHTGKGSSNNKNELEKII